MRAQASQQRKGVLCEKTLTGQAGIGAFPFDESGSHVPRFLAERTAAPVAPWTLAEHDKVRVARRVQAVVSWPPFITHDLR
jgi:hypothetical protein